MLYKLITLKCDLEMLYVFRSRYPMFIWTTHIIRNNKNQGFKTTTSDITKDRQLF